MKPALRHAIGAGALFVLLGAGAPTGASGQRTYIDMKMGSLRPLWLRRDEADTTLLQPNMLLIHEGRVYLTDPKGPAVVALDAATGKTLWRYTRHGAGPGELRQLAFPFWHARGVGVVDNGNRRLYLFSPDGRLLEQAGIPQGGFASSACSFADGTVLLSIAVLTGNSLIAMRFGSDAFSYYPFPLPLAPDPPPLDRAMDLTSMAPAGPYECFAARKTTDGFAVLARNGTSRRAQFIEHVRTRPYKEVGEIRDTSDVPIPFSLHPSVSGDTAFVWFGGNTCSHRCIDLYHLPDMRYLATIRIVGRTGIAMYNLSVEGDRVVMLGDQDGIPTVAAFRLPIGPGR